MIQKIGIAIVEDNPEFAQSCADRLMGMEETLKVEIFRSAESFSVANSNDFDLVFLNTILPGKSGIELLKEKGGSEVSPKYVMLSTIDSDEALFQAVRAGAAGFVLKKDLRDITEVTRIFLEEGGVLSPGLAARVISFLRRPPKKETYSLTPREKEILDRIVSGAKTKEIAEHFGTKEGTVRIQIKSIFKKLQVNSRVDLVRKYCQS